jgi:hypothetical protein
VFNVAHQQVVLRLQGNWRGESPRGRNPYRLGELPAKVVGEAVVRNLASGHRVVEKT